MSELDDVLSGLSSRDLLVKLLTYAVRCPSVAELAVTKLEPLHFNEATQVEFVYVWFAAKVYWQEHGTVPPLHVVRDVAVQAMQKSGYTDSVYFAGVHKLVDEIYGFTEEPWNGRYGLRLLNAFFDLVYIENLKLLATQQTSRHEIKQKLDEQHHLLQVASMPTMDPFNLDEHPMDFEPRNPTGFTPGDLLLNGGTLPTECYGILGPSGGGKTLMALQITGSLAKRHKRVAYFGYEQPAKDLQPRLLSFVAKIHIDKIRDRKFADIEEKYRKKLLKAAGLCRGYVDLVDRASEGNSISEIDLYVRKQADAGRKPDMVVIDWMWPLILRMAAISSRQQRPERIELQEAMDGLKAIAAKHKICLLILHQLSTEMVKKSPSNKPAWFNSAEAGSFAWLLHYCFAIGRADGNGYCWLVGSKSRNAANKDVLVRLNGGMNRFDPVDNSMTYDPSSKTFVEEEEMGKIPGAQSQTTTAPQEDESDEPLGGEEADYAGED